MDTVIVGRPYKTFFGATEQFTPQTVEYWQGVVIESYQKLPLGGMIIKSCNSYFANRSNYAGPRKATNPAQARAAHFDLSCGYSGQFTLRCTQNASEKITDSCSMKADISTCQPPTYNQALDSCYAIPTTTTPPKAFTGPSVPDWLGVEDINHTLAALPQAFDIAAHTPKKTAAPCCEGHVGSVCRPDQNFPGTVGGRWQAKDSFDRKHGYFPVKPCEQQAKSVPRPCPRVKINVISSAYLQWSHCLSACSNAKAQAEFAQICNRTKHPEIKEKEDKAHQDKIKSMKAKAASLEAWTKGRMATVTESKEVLDCFADSLPRRYNGMALPTVRSGFDKMPLHNMCRLHGCSAKQCLEVKRTCKVPYVQDAPEEMCPVSRPNGSFTCMDKVSIWTNNPMSLGFGIAWIVIGSIFFCAAVATFVRAYNAEGGSGGGRRGSGAGERDNLRQ